MVFKSLKYEWWMKKINSLHKWFNILREPAAAQESGARTEANLRLLQKSVWSGSGSSISGWIPIWIQGFHDRKFKKNLHLKKNHIFLIKKCNLFIPRPPKRRIFQPSKENIWHFQNMKFLNFFYFCGSYLPSWIRIHWPDWIRVRKHCFLRY